MARQPHFVLFDTDHGHTHGMLVIRDSSVVGSAVKILLAPAGDPWHAFEFSSADLDELIKALQEYQTPALKVVE